MKSSAVVSRNGNGSSGPPATAPHRTELLLATLAPTMSHGIESVIPIVSTSMDSHGCGDSS